MEEYRSPPKNYVTPLKESVGKQLRKVAILKSHKKYKEAKEIATSLRSKFKVSEIAALSREACMRFIDFCHQNENAGCRNNMSKN